MKKMTKVMLTIAAVLATIGLALMIAASKGLDFIDSDIIILAVNDMELA